MDFLGGATPKGRETQAVFIVQCNPREPDGIRKITTATRNAALEVATDFLKQGMRFVTVTADADVYTVEDFAATMPRVREC
jgi:hypothetical protein